ncbi:MAG: Hsp33 family molecular chaperone [Pseudomonadota bacterium]
MTSDAPPIADDRILPFQIADTAVRGRVVRMSDSIDAILSAHQFPSGVSELVGESAALVAMMGAALKFDGKLIFQAQGDGPLSMVVADYATTGAVRATASFIEEIGSEVRGVPQLLGKGHVAMTVDQGAEMERYQGVTPIDGEALSDLAVSYFMQSEQIPTVVRLAVGRVSTPGAGERWRAGGIMAQFVPSEGGERERGEEILLDADDKESWARAEAFLETTQADELIDPSISSEELLYRLFHEDGVRVFDAQPLRADCQCDVNKVSAVLARYTAEDLSDMVEDGVITVSCEFCRKGYRFSPEGNIL